MRLIAADGGARQAREGACSRRLRGGIHGGSTNTSSMSKQVPFKPIIQTTFSATKEFMCKTDDKQLQSNGSERKVSSKGCRALVQFFIAH